MISYTVLKNIFISSLHDGETKKLLKSSYKEKKSSCKEYRKFLVIIF